jgi:hypothetical protein
MKFICPELQKKLKFLSCVWKKFFNNYILTILIITQELKLINRFYYTIQNELNIIVSTIIEIKLKLY